MAIDDLNALPEAVKVTSAEIDALADRMLARAASKLFEAQPNLRSDMLLAVGCLRELARDNSQLEVRVWRDFGP